MIKGCGATFWANKYGWVKGKKLNPELRVIKAADAIKAFERAGGIPKSGKGDHVNIKMPNGRIITLRGKGEVKVGRLRDAIGEAGLAVEEFLELLK